MGKWRRRELGEYNRARRSGEPIANWPKRLTAAILQLAGTAGAVALIVQISSETHLDESGEVPLPSVRCFALGVGLVLLCLFSYKNARVLTGPNDVQLFGWVKELFRGSLLLFVLIVVFFALLAAFGAFAVVAWLTVSSEIRWFTGGLIGTGFVLLSCILSASAEIVFSEFPVAIKLRSSGLRRSPFFSMEA